MADYRTEENILEEMVTKAVEKGLISVTEDTMEKLRKGEPVANQYILDLSTHAYILAELEKSNYENTQRFNLATATGEDLDAFGALLNVARYPAQQSVVDITLSVETNDNNHISVPRGTRVLLTGIYAGMEYVTSEEAVLSSEVTSTTIRAESLDFGVQTTLPRGAVTGLEGYPLLTVTNDNAGTSGRNVEEDDEYRVRIMNWAAGNAVGTKQYIENYLSQYDGIDSFRLVPRYDGVGTLKIVCDTLSSLLPQVSADVYEHAMLLTDVPPLCVQPGEETLSTLEVYVHIAEDTLLNMTQSELEQLIIAQARTFVEGGFTRYGNRIRGMAIGSTFYPSSLWNYLSEQIPEIDNIRTDIVTPYVVGDTKLFHVNTFEVTFE